MSRGRHPSGKAGPKRPSQRPSQRSGSKKTGSKKAGPSKTSPNKGPKFGAKAEAKASSKPQAHTQSPSPARSGSKWDKRSARGEYRPAKRPSLDNGLEQLEGRNPVIEALLRKRRAVRKVWLDERARQDDKVRRLVSLCEQAGVRIERVNREHLDRMAAGEVHNGVIAHADQLPEMTVQQLLDQVYARGEVPFLVLADEISYEHNLGAILRSALGAGVHGVVVPTKRGKGLSPVVHRVSMGGAEAVPLVREGLSSALKICHKAGLRIVGADMGGVSHWDLDWTIPTALVLGGESKGLSSTLRNRCDAIVGVPLQGELESLNVSVTAGIMLFERARQLSRQS